MKKESSSARKLSVDCPVCGQSAGSPCVPEMYHSVTKVRKVHIERKELAMQRKNRRKYAGKASFSL